MTTVDPTATEAAPAATKDQTLGILSLITAIVSVASGFVPLGSALAIVLGALAMRRETASRKLATAGILVGAIPIALMTGFAVFAPFAFLTALPFGLWGFWG